MRPVDQVLDLTHRAWEECSKYPWTLRLRLDYIESRLTSLAEGMRASGHVDFEGRAVVHVDVSDNPFHNVQTYFTVHVPGVGDVTYPPFETLDVMEESLVEAGSREP